MRDERYNPRHPRHRELMLSPERERFETLWADGMIWRDDTGAIVGRASDGAIVQLGNEPGDVAAYLAAHPTPEDW